MSSLTKHNYEAKALPALKKLLGTENPNALPKIDRVVVNVGVGKFLKENNRIEEIRTSSKSVCGRRFGVSGCGISSIGSST